MQTPTPYYSQSLNLNVLSLGPATVYGSVIGAREGLFAKVLDLSPVLDIVIKADDHERYHNSLIDSNRSNATNAYQHPHSDYIQPVFARVQDPSDLNNNNQDDNPVVGFLIAIIPWDRFVIRLLPDGVRGITCVLRNTCGQAYTYQLDGNTVRNLVCRAKCI
jgi:hypothetical protein